MFTVHQHNQVKDKLQLRSLLKKKGHCRKVDKLDIGWLSLLMELRHVWQCFCKQLIHLCGLPITLLAKEVRMRVASPRSPILTEPVGPVMKMLSHLRSRWTIGGVLVWRKWSPFRICLHQLLRTLVFISLKRFRYLCVGTNTYFVKTRGIYGSSPGQ